jgi:hypothetical protein
MVDSGVVGIEDRKLDGVGYGVQRTPDRVSIGYGYDNRICG